jgi:hypothetical protein
MASDKEKTAAVEEPIAPIRFSSERLRFVFFFDRRGLLWYRKDFKKLTAADEREADEVLDLLLQEPAGFA